MEIIKDFISTLNRRCRRYNKCGCARIDNCGMKDSCHKGFRLTDEDVDKLYDIYLKDDSEYADELEIAREIKLSGIPISKIRQAIEMIK